MARTATPVNFTLSLAGQGTASAVSRALIEAIAAGQIHDGDPLPSTRTLAASLRLARSAVVGAYEELAAAGFLAARAGGSTYVEQGAAAAARAGAFGAPLPQAPLPQAPVQQAPVQQAPVQQAPVQRAAVQRASVQRASVQRASVQRASVQQAPLQQAAVQQGRVQRASVRQAPLQRSPAREPAPGRPAAATPAAGTPGGPPAYDLRPGLADTALISERDWARAAREAAAVARQPDDGTGLPGELGMAEHAQARRQLAAHLRRARGLAAEPTDIFLFPSIVDALEAVAVVCGLPGAQVAFEDPGYAKARLALQRVGVRIRPIAVDDDGVQAGDLRSRDRAVYVTPAHQWPLGGRMPAHRRAQLLDWAQRADALILEDDYDGEFRYGVPPLPPLRAMPAATGRVVYFGTSAKVLTRGLRVSWALLPARFRDAMTGHLSRSGETVSTFATALLASYIAGGALTRHQARALRTYSARQARFVAACRELIPGVQAHGIEAGLHVVLTFAAGTGAGGTGTDRTRGGGTGRRLDDVAAVGRLAALGLACAPLSAYYADPATAAKTGLICGYSRLPETRARAAAALIAQVAADLA